MNNAYLDRARSVIPDPKNLILLASKRARQLAYGARPMVRCKDENYLDVALLEIAEGMLAISYDGGDDDVLKDFAAAREAAENAAATHGDLKKKMDI
jgi:DNA-directed RNA polymerase omega subunit